MPYIALMIFYFFHFPSEALCLLAQPFLTSLLKMIVKLEPLSSPNRSMFWHTSLWVLGKPFKSFCWL